MLISDQLLLEYNRRGFVPGPLETEEAYQQRVDYCLQLEETHIAPLRRAHQVPSVDKEHYYQPALSITQNLFDIAPDWVPLFFSNEKLSPWHGGCAWIFQETEQSPLAAVLQVRRVFSSQETYLKMYRREELLAHELTHVGRMSFEEPGFEELLAYRTSHCRFRRYFGPIIQSMGESALLLLVALLLFLIDGILLFSGAFDLYQQMMWLKAIPLGLVGYGLWRLWSKQRCYKRCLNRLGAIVGAKKAAAVAYRLTDAEIRQFSMSTEKEIESYARMHKEQSLRWRLIWLAYFS